MRALDIITDAYERINRLSPGETLSADDAAFGFRRLNLLVDELSAQNLFLYRDILASSAQTGHITLGAGAWAAISPGSEIVSATVDGLPLSSLTMEQYNTIATPTDTGSPYCYAHDGLSTVYLYPVATGQTVKLQSRIGVLEFADQTTVYTAPSGYRALLGAGLAVRIAPALLGTVPASLLRAEMKCMLGAYKYQPAIVDVNAFTDQPHMASRILRGY